MVWCGEVAWFGVWGGGMFWRVWRWYGLVCVEVVWFGVWGGGMVCFGEIVLFCLCIMKYVLDSCTKYVKRITISV